MAEILTKEKAALLHRCYAFGTGPCPDVDVNIHQAVNELFISGEELREQLAEAEILIHDLAVVAIEYPGWQAYPRAHKVLNHPTIKRLLKEQDAIR